MNAVAKLFAKPLVLSPERRVEADADQMVVARVQAGEVAAFDELILRYRERMVGLIYQMTSNREDAADLAQDVFIKAFQSIRRFEGQSSFFTWLYRIAVNTTLTHLRRQRTTRFFSLEKMQEDSATAGLIARLTDATGADRETFARELQEKLNEALQKLSIKHRTVITLFEIEGLSHEEIARIMRCSTGTVRSRVHYAKQLLQAELQAYIRS
ncbi:MAG: sigma-70 family RNA polymerase sigma factor [Verrucomicrobiota bacterium]